MPKQALWQRLRAAAVAYHDPSLRDLLEEAAAEVLSLEQGWSNCSRACARETDRADRAEKALCVPSACTSQAYEDLREALESVLPYVHLEEYERMARDVLAKYRDVVFAVPKGAE